MEQHAAVYHLQVLGAGGVYLLVKALEFVPYNDVLTTETSR